MKISEALHDESFWRALRLPARYADQQRGGQELIMPEIISLLLHHETKSLWLPYSLGLLAREARSHGIAVNESRKNPAAFDALYFGTPTILYGRKLFDESAEGEWNVQTEYAEARSLCMIADAMRSCTLIVSGLGTGDVSSHDRRRAMRLEGWSAPRLVCWKDFGEFEDSLFITMRMF